jgi:hypothetical protein
MHSPGALNPFHSKCPNLLSKLEKTELCLEDPRRPLGKAAEPHSFAPPVPNEGIGQHLPSEPSLPPEGGNGK